MTNVAEKKWKQVPGYEDIYSVSSCGVLRMDRKCKKWGSVERTGSPNADGYLRVSMTKDGKRQKWFMHRIVALAFIGLNPKGLEVNHRDGNKTNNHASNLEYVTHKNNMKHAVETKLWNPNQGDGFDSPTSKMTREKLSAVIGLKGQTSANKASKITGVHRNTISKIWRGESNFV